MAKHWLTLERDLKLRKLLKLSVMRLGIESSRGILWLVRAAVQGTPELLKEGVSLIELASLLVVKVAPKVKTYIGKFQDGIDLAFSRIDRILIDLSKTIAAVPVGGYYFDVDEQIEANSLPAATIDDPITNIQEATKGRHLIILGDTGTGKTTTAQYVAVENAISGEVTVKVYDCEGMFKLLPGWQLIGAGEDFDAINQSMEQDLEALKQFFQSGQPEAKEPTHIYIGEEFPDIADQCKAAPEWTDRHSRRGRKAGRFLILLSQYDQIAAFGLEGKSGLLKNFRIIRLGEFALAHAKRLKNPTLVKWLEANRSHCLINDVPLRLPSYEEMTRVIGQSRLSLASVSPQSPAVIQAQFPSPVYNRIESHNGHTPVLATVQSSFAETPETTSRPTENQGFQPPETRFLGTAGNAEIALLEGILSRLKGGDSADKVAKWLKENYSMGYSRARSLVDTALTLLEDEAAD